MSFNTIKIKKVRRKYNKLKNQKLQNFIVYGAISFATFCLILLFFIYIKFISVLPDIDKLEQLDFKKSSIIYDKEGNQLYTLSGDEKRTYVKIDSISKNMINAIVAGEDNTFFENSGIDYLGIVRAVIYRVIGKTDDIKGTSTISQQLIKNVFLSNERSYERKIKEAYLSFRMNQTYSKQKIMELYLNKIGFGSNIYGVEQASKTYFGKNIKDVSVIEASILASLPKGPTYYSLYNYPYRVLGYVYFYTQGDETTKAKIYTEQDFKQHGEKVKKIYDIVKEYKGTKLGDNGLFICGMNKADYKNELKIDNDGCLITKASELENILNSIQIKNSGEILEYQTGRKDYILGRMLDDGYIDFDQYKDAFLKGFGFKINQKIEKIKYPHFVMYIKEYLSEKYGEELIQGGGLKIYTTLDPNLQNKAEEIVSEQVKINNTKYGSNNGSLISIDNKNGDILAFVGGANYYDKNIDGQVNMITSLRQPGSTFKSFVYALAIDKNKIGSDSPIYDLPTVFPGKYEPKNYDGEFMGRMSFRDALNYSRNIPAIKAYFLAGEQNGIIDYLEKTGVKSLNKDFYYGAPLALGSGEMTALELAGAYSVFANMGNKVDINPIQKILDSNGNIIEEKKISSGIKVMDESTAYIINNMLSDTKSRPSGWNSTMALNGRVAAAKTGTSNKLFIKYGKKEYYPGDLWTAGYTPQITTVVWAGNTNGKQIYKSGSGLGGASPMWKKYMEFAHLYKEKETWEQPKSVSRASISKLSGLLVPTGYDKNFIISSLFKNKPTSYDNSLKPIEVDELCNGKVTSNTPSGAIKSGYYIELRDIDPTRIEWQKSILERLKNGGGQKEFGNIPNIITFYQDAECSRSSNLVENALIDVNAEINEGSVFLNGSNQIKVSYKSNNPLRKIQFLLGANIVGEVAIENEKVGTYNGTFNIPSGYDGEYDLTIRIIDSIYYSGEKSYKINIIQKDDISPIITVTNPSSGNIGIYEDQFFNLRFNVFDNSTLRAVNIYIDDKPYKLGLKGNEHTIEINDQKNISVGGHTIKIEAVDFSFNKGETFVDIEILGR